MEQRCQDEIGDAGRVLLVVTECIVAVVPHKQPQLTESVCFLQLFVHGGLPAVPSGLVAGLRHGILPESGFSVHLSQLFDALVIHHLVLYIPEQVCRLGNHLLLPGQRIRRLKQLFGIPYDEILFPQVPVGGFILNIAVSIILHGDFPECFRWNSLSLIHFLRFFLSQFPAAKGKFPHGDVKPFSDS